MDKWKCNTCGWIYDPAQGDTENGICMGTAFEDLPDTWSCPICASTKDMFELEIIAPKPTDAPNPDDEEQELSLAEGKLFRERFENVFRVAQKMTSSMNIS